MIIGQKVTLLPFDEKWVETVRGWVNQPDVRSGTGAEGPVSDFEHRRWYEQLMSDRGHRVFVIGQGHGMEAEPIGLIGLKHINERSRSAEYWIYVGSAAARRKGLAEEATWLILDFGFDTLNLHTIYLAVLETNTAALFLYKKLGFFHEGTTRDRLFRNGRFVSLLNYSMTEEEFRAHCPACANETLSNAGDTCRPAR